MIRKLIPVLCKYHAVFTYNNKILRKLYFSAAAYWRGSTNSSKVQQERERQTLFYFWNLSGLEEHTNIGLMRSKFNEYWENKQDFTEPWLKKEIFDTKEAQELEMIYCHIKQAELPDNVVCGISYFTGMYFLA